MAGEFQRPALRTILSVAAESIRLIGRSAVILLLLQGIYAAAKPELLI